MAPSWGGGTRGERNAASNNICLSKRLNLGYSNQEKNWDNNCGWTGPTGNAPNWIWDLKGEKWGKDMWTQGAFMIKMVRIFDNVNNENEILLAMWWAKWFATETQRGGLFFFGTEATHLVDHRHHLVSEGVRVLVPLQYDPEPRAAAGSPPHDSALITAV